jgi:hypothetical protein
VTSGRLSDERTPAELGTALAVAVIVELLSWWLRQSAPWPAERVAAILYERIIVPSVP